MQKTRTDVCVIYKKQENDFNFPVQAGKKGRVYTQHRHWVQFGSSPRITAGQKRAEEPNNTSVISRTRMSGVSRHYSNHSILTNTRSANSSIKKLVLWINKFGKLIYYGIDSCLIFKLVFHWLDHQTLLKNNIF